METSGQINYPAPLPEDTADALLTEMQTPAPYKVLEKTKKAMGTRKSCRRQASLDSSSNNSAMHSSPSGGREEEEGFPNGGGRRVQEGKDPSPGLFRQCRCRCQNQRISGRGSQTVRLGGW